MASDNRLALSYVDNTPGRDDEIPELCKGPEMLRFPAVARGQTVGLFGGSFDPAHGGHVHVTREALKRFGLDRVWWLVSPGNPLKENGPAPIARRMEQARRIMQHPRVEITDIEARLGTRYTAETIAALQHHRPAVRFVWLMGADNLAQFHHWQDWEEIVARAPIGVLARPGERLDGLTARLPQVYRSARLAEAGSQGLGQSVPPSWCFVNIPMRSVSSTEIRQAARRKADEIAPANR